MIGTNVLGKIWIAVMGCSGSLNLYRKPISIYVWAEVEFHKEFANKIIGSD